MLVRSGEESFYKLVFQYCTRADARERYRDSKLFLSGIFALQIYSLLAIGPEYAYVHLLFTLTVLSQYPAAAIGNITGLQVAVAKIVE